MLLNISFWIEFYNLFHFNLNVNNETINVFLIIEIFDKYALLIIFLQSILLNMIFSIEFYNLYHFIFRS